MKIGRIFLPYGAKTRGDGCWEVFNREYHPLCSLKLTAKQEGALRKHAIHDSGDMIHFYHIKPKPCAYGRFLEYFYDLVGE